jgi:hypothetical protein
MLAIEAKPAWETSEEVDVLKGHDFSRAENGAKSTRALALEGLPGAG